jgi:NADH:ubiquinone oxidoreductase subunit 6 (subunit J)
MLARLVRIVLLVLSTLLMASAFLPLSTPNPSRSLMLLGAGLVSLATVTRRHFADE